MLFRLNEGFFLDNGRCGYILKPSELTSEDRTYKPYRNLPVRAMLHIRVRIWLVFR
jgi:hypothetical protein